MELEFWHIWLLLSISLFLVEIFMSSFISACFGIGAILTGISAHIGFGVLEQLLVFVICSATLLVILKPFIKQILNSKAYIPDNKTYNIIGKEAIVLEEINAHRNLGRIIVAGSTWKAKSQSGEIIPKDSFVEILYIDYSVTIVKPI